MDWAERPNAAPMQQARSHSPFPRDLVFTDDLRIENVGVVSGAEFARLDRERGVTDDSLEQWLVV